MAVFGYTATDGEATVTTGAIVADTPRQARDRLRERGLSVHEILEQSAGSPRRRASVAWQAVSSRGTRGGGRFAVDFVRELSTLLGVGTPLLEAIDLLMRQQPKKLKPILLQLHDQVAAGVSLAEAMRQQPLVFDEVTVAMTQVGESAGTLDAVLGELAEFKQRSAQLRGRIGSALIYPAIVLLAGTGVAIFLMTYVVPSLLHSLIQAGRPLPLITRIVKGVSDFLLHDWWLLLLIVIVCVGGFIAILGTAQGRRAWDSLLLRIPGVGELIRKQAVVRIAFVIATLMRSGIAFEKAVAIAQHSTKNVILRHALRRCEQAVTAGRDIGDALQGTGAFSLTVVQVFSLGQQSGRLEEMLERLAKDYDAQVATAATRVAAVIEPILILLLATIVGAIAFATMLPILEMGNAI